MYSQFEMFDDEFDNDILLLFFDVGLQWGWLGYEWVSNLGDKGFRLDYMLNLGVLESYMCFTFGLLLTYVKYICHSKKFNSIKVIDESSMT